MIRKKIIITMLCFVGFLFCYSTASASATSGTLPNSQVSWNYDTATGKLTISGTGEMPQLGYSSDFPWYIYQDSVKSIEISEGVTSVANFAFTFYRQVTSVSLPEGLTALGQQSFSETSITSLVIPGTVSFYDGMVFENCDKLKKVTFEKTSGMGSIITANGVLVDCDSLDTIIVDPDDVFLKAHDNVLYVQNKLWIYPNGKKEKSYSIYPGTEEIFFEAFTHNNTLENIIIPEGVKTINKYSFWNVSKLKSIIIPSSVETLGSDGEDPIVNCFSLAKIINRSSASLNLNNIQSGNVLFNEWLKEGTSTKITALANGTAVGDFNVFINKIASKSNLTIKAGSKYKITYNVLPANTTFSKAVKFESLDKKIATVSSTGVITAIKPGTTTIIISSVASPEITAYISLNVTKAYVKKNTRVTINQAIYKVISSSKKKCTVMYMGPVNKKAKKIKIAKSVKILGHTYKVQSISVSAIKKCKKLKQIKMPSKAIYKAYKKKLKKYKLSY